MKNIELKIKVDNFKEIEESLKKIGTKYNCELIQKDTYFKTRKNRLKLREINNTDYELIYYKRDNIAVKKMSDYQLILLSKDQYKQTKKKLTNSPGVKIIVSKRRALWLYKNTRIHLDKVNRLGDFLELETVLSNISREQGEREYFELIDILGLNKFQKIKQSYCDLLQAI